MYKGPAVEYLICMDATSQDKPKEKPKPKEEPKPDEEPKFSAFGGKPNKLR